jgi:phenylacetate-CoA ligase
MSNSELLQRLYRRSPVFLQDLGVTLYGVKVYLREYGRKFDRMLLEFEQHLTWSPAQLRAYQDERLRALILHSYEHVPYYREVMRGLRLTPGEIRSVDDLHKLPLLTRQQVMENGDRLVARNAGRADRIVGHTSGTTGSPMQLVWDRQVCLAKTVVDWRQKRLAGLNPGDPIAFFLGRQVAPLGQEKPPFWRHNRVLRHLFCSSFHLSPKHLPSYFDALERFQPRAIEGYPSTLSILAGYLNSRRETFPLQAVLASSETLLPAQRESIEKAFGCRVFDFYGMAERTVFATECEEHRGKHLNIDFGHVEVLAGGQQAAANAEMGRIVTTGLHNFSMPLLRYETSDVTARQAEPCRCGCAMPVMSGVATKDEDIVVTPDGRFVSSSILNAVTHHLTNIVESQIIQESVNQVSMKVVPGPGYGDEDSQFIKKALGEVLGDSVGVSIELVESIPRSASGKFRWVISKVPLGF